MPKMKGHSGAKKRFKTTASGRIVGKHAMTSHNLGPKSARRKRRLGRPAALDDVDRPRVKRLLHP